MTRVMNHIDLVLFAALVMFGWFLLACRPWGIGHDQAEAASLAGALFGGAALLLGNWINRANDRFKAAQEEAGQVEKLKTMIASELVNVGCGLMSAKQLVDAAVISARWWPSTRCIGFEPLSASAMHGRSDGRRSLWPAESDLAVGKSGPRHGRSCRSVYSYRTDSHVFHCRCRAGTCDRNPQARS